MIWDRAPMRREAYYADHCGRRLFVERTVRSDRAHGLIGQEFKASVSGLGVGEFATIGAAKQAARDAAETKTAPR